MASGDTILSWMAYSNEPPSASYATLDTRNQRPVLDFADSGSESGVFGAILPRHYAGGGITAYHHVAFSSATAGSAVIQGAFERVGAELLDLDEDNFAAAVTANVDVPLTAGSVFISPIAFTDGAQIDSLAVGEYFRYKFTRQGESVTDDASGDMELIGIELKET
jgi:hypothetical protein